MSAVLRYGRVLLKLSGEALMGRESSGVSAEVLRYIVSELKAAREMGAQVGLVCGGGTLFGARVSRRGWGLTG